MYRYCIWTIILLNHGIKIFIDGLCTTEPGSNSTTRKMVCRDCDEKELPDTDRSYTYETLDIRGCKNMVLSREKLLGRFLNIQEFYASDISPKQRKDLPIRSTFNYLTELTVMSFTNSALTDEESWALPRDLLRYNVDGNLYTNLDLRLCPKLTEFSGNKNQLLRIPIFSDPAYVENVYLRGNPLVNVRVFDLASLCQLKTLEAELQSNAFADTNEGACQCEQLKEWTRKFSISGLQATCPKAKGQNNCNFDFRDELVIRENCQQKTTAFTAKTYTQVDLITSIILIAVCVAVPVVLGTIVYRLSDDD